MAIEGDKDLRSIRTFPSLVKYLRDELGWPIGGEDFEELTFEYTPEELGIDEVNAAKIQEIKRLRPLETDQPWGIFFVKFEPKRLPVVALRRILSRVALKKRASANAADRLAWAADDLLFISNYGEGEDRQITFAHFSVPEKQVELPVLKVLGWDSMDTHLHLDDVEEKLHEFLAWPENTEDPETWRVQWRSAFTLRHLEVITTSKELAKRLAELARAIRDRIQTALKIETNEGHLRGLMENFKDALVHDLDEKQFADMYAQTIAYGLLSARIADPTANTFDDFAGHMRTNPFLRELMESFMNTGAPADVAAIDFDELGVNEVVELLDAANMEAVLREFGNQNPDEDPVIHFYELFLKEYNPEDRLQRGVFYTPRPAVSFIVRSAHEVLQERFGLEDGLADIATWEDVLEASDSLELPPGVSPSDRFVTVLDPATGTGTFLVEAIEVIYSTLRENWKSAGKNDEEIDDLWNQYVPEHLLPRLHGYELLMAPYAIAHVKIGLKLHETGYRFAAEERARVFLTNALEEPLDSTSQFEFAIPALAHEAAAVDSVKRDQVFTVVLGNPPYSLLSANLSPEARALVEPYKSVDGERIRERGALQFEKNIQDDYVKFIRLAELVTKRAQVGVVALITNHAYIDNTTFRGLRWNLLTTFDSIDVLDLNGNAKRGLDQDDQNVFEIQQGVAITVAVKETSAGKTLGVVRHADMIGRRTSKYEQLLAKVDSSIDWNAASPDPPAYFFLPRAANQLEFNSGIQIDEFFDQYSSGVITARDHLVVDVDRERLKQRIIAFRDSQLTDAELLEAFGVSKKKGWDVGKAREDLAAVVSVDDFIKPITYRPMDQRWVFYHQSLIWTQALPTFRGLLGNGNLAVMTTRKVEAGTFAHAMVVDGLSECHSVSMKEVNYVFPLYRAEDVGWGYEEKFELTSNLKAPALESLLEHAGGEVTPEGFLAYVYALLHSPGYRQRYEEMLAGSFPRVSIPKDRKLLDELTELGFDLMDLHLFKTKFQAGITVAQEPNGNWKFSYGEDDETKSRIEFLGNGNPRVSSVGWSDGIAFIDAEKKRVDGTQVTTGTTGFAGIEEDVWLWRLGSYPVCEKWLRERGTKRGTPGPRFEGADLVHFHRMVAAVEGTINLQNEVEDLIAEHGGWPDAFATEPLSQN